MFHKALVPTDGSTFSAAALRHVPDLTTEAAVVLRVPVGVATLLAEASPPVEVDAKLAREWTEAELADVREQLAQAKTALEASGVRRVETVVGEGRPGEAILRAAKEHGCDVIVIATHGRTGIAQALLGSVAAYVVHNAGDLPVLLIRPPAA